jgi:hypothetical protein
MRDTATTPSPLDCATCGAHGTWHPARQAVVCPRCDATIDGVDTAGGAVESFEFLPLLRDRPDSGGDWQPVHPSGVAPFAIGAGDVRERFDAWLDAKRTFGLRRNGFAVDTVRAVYLPCWMFSARARVPWRGEIQKKDRKGQYEPHPIDGVVEETFDDVLVPASGSTPNEQLHRIEPFPVEDLRAYDTRYLAGYEVEACGVDLRNAWDAADARMQEKVDDALRQSAGVSPSALETWPEWSGHRCRHVLVPVYAIDYAYRGVRHCALVNGRTGQTAGRLPKDPLAMATGILILLAILAALAAAIVGLLKAVF